ncbi:hypothetical protein [Methylotenera sp.]|uniref:hypothetical protein n=1 Tax=Methylotenera sp. TaxID=2051956 RepID=UPI00248A04BB|nr:hypothetical protein [Methylotenera sp.]MDI1362269.1 hypothetical protein [Methylotenera sp.]
MPHPPIKRNALKPADFAFTPSENQLCYKELANMTVLRTMFVVVGLAAIAWSYVFVDIIYSMGQIVGAAKIGGLIASILSIIAFWMFGGYCLKQGLLLPRQTVVFDKGNRQIVYISHTPLLGIKERKYEFSAITNIKILENLSEDEATTYSLVMSVLPAKSIVMGVFHDHAQAENSLQDVRQAVGYLA